MNERRRSKTAYLGKTAKPIGVDTRDLLDLAAHRVGDARHVAACLRAGGFGRNEMLPNGRVVFVKP